VRIRSEHPLLCAALLLALAAGIEGVSADEPVKIVLTMGHSAKITSLAYSPDGRTIISASDDRTVKIWDAATARELRTLESGARFWGTRFVAYSPNSRTIASGAAIAGIR
jgi:WD40 repeat protein